MGREDEGHEPGGRRRDLADHDDRVRAAHGEGVDERVGELHEEHVLALHEDHRDLKGHRRCIRSDSQRTGAVTFQLVDVRSSWTRIACAEARAVRGGELGVVANELCAGGVETGAKVGHGVDRLLGLEQEAPDVADPRRVALGAAGARVGRRHSVDQIVDARGASSARCRGPASPEGPPAAPVSSTTASTVAGVVAAQVPATTGASPTPMQDAARTSWSNDVTVRPVRPSAAPASAASRGVATTRDGAVSGDELVGRLHRGDAVVRRGEDHHCARERTRRQVELVGRAVEDPHARRHDSGSDLDAPAGLRSTSTTARRPSAARVEHERGAARDDQARSLGKRRREPPRGARRRDQPAHRRGSAARGGKLGRHGPRLPGTSRPRYAALLAPRRRCVRRSRDGRAAGRRAAEGRVALRSRWGRGTRTRRSVEASCGTGVPSRSTPHAVGAPESRAGEAARR